MLEGPEEGQLQTTDRLEAQLSLELCIEYIQVDVVILQLVEDIEWSVVRRVVLSWVEDTRGIRSVGIGVDVEVALDLTTYDVYILTERTRRTLVTVGRTPDDIQREALQEVMRDVEVSGISLDLTLLVPSWIDEGGGRGVVVRLARTTAHAHRVGLHDGGREELLEPVCIASLSLLEISVLSLRRIVEQEGAGLGIVRVDQLVHLTIDPIVTAVEDLGEVQPSLIA